MISNRAQFPIRIICRNLSFTYPTTTLRSPTDYFQLMEIQPTFEISKEDLKHAYKEHMKKLHPDKHTLKSLEERELIAEQASQITRGYDVLKDDYERALHLLELGGNKMEDDFSGNILGHAFLMDVMEIRESVEDTSDADILMGLLDENKRRIEETCNELAVAFKDDNLDEAVRLAAKLQYWNRIQESILEKS